MLDDDAATVIIVGLGAGWLAAVKGDMSEEIQRVKAAVLVYSRLSGGR